MNLYKHLSDVRATDTIASAWISGHSRTHLQVRQLDRSARGVWFGRLRGLVYFFRILLFRYVVAELTNSTLHPPCRLARDSHRCTVWIDDLTNDRFSIQRRKELECYNPRSHHSCGYRNRQNCGGYRQGGIPKRNRQQGTVDFFSEPIECSIRGPADPMKHLL